MSLCRCPGVCGAVRTGPHRPLSRLCFDQGADDVDDFIRLSFINILAFDHGALERETTDPARVLYDAHGQFLVQEIVKWTDNQADSEKWRQKQSEQQGHLPGLDVAVIG